VVVYEKVWLLVCVVKKEAVVVAVVVMGCGVNVEVYDRVWFCVLVVV